MSVEKLFIGSDILDGRNGFSTFPCQHTINQQHRITMWQVLFDLIDIESFADVFHTLLYLFK